MTSFSTFCNVAKVIWLVFGTQVTFVLQVWEAMELKENVITKDIGINKFFDFCKTLIIDLPNKVSLLGKYFIESFILIVDHYNHFGDADNFSIVEIPTFIKFTDIFGELASEIIFLLKRPLSNNMLGSNCVSIVSDLSLTDQTEIAAASYEDKSYDGDIYDLSRLPQEARMILFELALSKTNDITQNEQKLYEQHCSSFEVFNKTLQTMQGALATKVILKPIFLAFISVLNMKY